VSAESRVLEALAAVHDPELDEPITSLGFVSSCRVSPDGDVEVHLRLPTPQCAPNFAFLMAADARNGVRGLPGVRDVAVVLEDHYTAAEINGAVGQGLGFSAAFPGESGDDDLNALRELFRRKALVARQARLCQALMADGIGASSICSLRVADLPDVADARRCLELRRELGMLSDPDSPAFVLPDGRPIAAEHLHRWLRMARLVQTSLDVNGGICRALLRIRHGVAADEPHEVRR
jgi:metal-sulfur cluster biosynthetic enzyme